jgi:glutathione peroxidase
MIRMLMVASAWLALTAGIASAEPRTAHDFVFTSIDGEPMPMRAFAGRAVLVVNTASLCGFTPQYTDLQALWQDYRDRGLVVLGVPSNDSASRSRAPPPRSRSSARSTPPSTSR